MQICFTGRTFWFWSRHEDKYRCQIKHLILWAPSSFSAAPWKIRCCSAPRIPTKIHLLPILKSQDSRFLWLRLFSRWSLMWAYTRPSLADSDFCRLCKEAFESLGLLWKCSRYPFRPLNHSCKSLTLVKPEAECIASKNFRYPTDTWPQGVHVWRKP